MIKVQQIQGKGEGAVATCDILPGVEIERCSITKLDRDQRRELKHCRGDIGDYPFVDREEWVRLSHNQRRAGCSGFMAWGAMSKVNHWTPGNCRVHVEWNEDSQIYEAVLTTTRRVKRDEEYLLEYPDAMEYDGHEDWAGPLDGVAHHGPDVAAKDGGVSFPDPAASLRSVPLRKLRDLREDDRG